MTRSQTDTLIVRHSELVKQIAYHLAGRLPAQVDVEDLVQAGMVGLLEAATHYSPGRGASFETYAGIRVRGAIIDSLRKLDWAPRSVRSKARAAARARREVENAFLGTAAPSSVAARLGVGVDEYLRVVRDAAACRLMSLEEMRSCDGVTADLLTEASADPYRDVTEEAMRDALVAAIDHLPGRERLVMSLYYECELNLKEIGGLLRVTESRVCQVHGQALARLRCQLAAWRDDEGTSDRLIRRRPRTVLGRSCVTPTTPGASPDGHRARQQ